VTAFFFVFRKFLAWAFLGVAILVVFAGILKVPAGIVFTVAAVLMTWQTLRAISHVQRVLLLTDRLDSAVLANRQRRQIEIPLEAGEAFDLVEAAIRELPRVESVEPARDSLQVRALVRRTDPYAVARKGLDPLTGTPKGKRRNFIHATVAPGNGTGSVTLVCEPEGGAWLDWFRVDDGTNLENAEGISRALTRRVSERRRSEQASAQATATEKELTVARLSLLQAQVEPHFLYNTLASAQVLTRSDPPRADRMLGHLIAFLRHSLPRTGDAVSTLGAEVACARAYLEILQVRMGERLRVQVEVPAALDAVPLPAMMLQTLVENAIKHGLEPLTGGGTLWIIARAEGERVAITVADDGRGFSESGSGTGIGLVNVRERLRLAYGESASFGIAANFPKGVAATITVPRTGPTGATNA
jgi:signal transduction histidine kinase